MHRAFFVFLKGLLSLALLVAAAGGSICKKALRSIVAQRHMSARPSNRCVPTRHRSLTRRYRLNF